MVKGITYILVNDATVTSLVGENAAGDTTKVYPVIATQDEAMPLVTVWQVARTPQFCKGQRSTTFNYGYEVHVFAKDYDAAVAIGNAIIDALETQDISSPINGVLFTDRIRNTDSKDGDYIEQYKSYRRILNFETMVNESQAT
jgi:hypothetical protein